MRPHDTSPIRTPHRPTDDPHLAALTLVHGSSCICHTCQRRFGTGQADLAQTLAMRGVIAPRSSFDA